jgi:alpha/beta hydrolase family protein
MKRALLMLGLVVLLAGSVQARVVRVDVKSREPWAAGREFGAVGSYELLRGRVDFALDPASDANRTIVDLELAGRNGRGEIEFSADLEILAPRELSKARGALLYDVNNRGNRTAVGQFNTGGDDFLMRQGFIVVSSGWIAEALPGGSRLRLDAPMATDHGRTITGVVRAEISPDKPAQRLSIAQWANQGSYRPSERGLADAVLTWRLRERDPRVVIPRAQWKLVETIVDSDGQRGQLPLVELELSGGFQPGYLYELVYEARDPLVQGVGLAGIRDLISLLKYDRSELNPLRLADGAPAARHAYGFGVSQSGRCLRMFLYDGFNADEQGRQVFDAVMPHVAGAGLGFFNHRFASPTRTNSQHDNHLYPADMFPFAYEDQRDPLSERVDGILKRSRANGTVPKVMHTQSSSEYWHRSGSLVHTDPLATRDAEVPPEVRIYTFGGCQHGPGSGIPGTAGNGQLPGCPSDYRPLLRALLLALDAWVREGRDPPPNAYPRLSDRTLAGWREHESGWQALPGVRYPEVIQQPELLDRGPEFQLQRRITIEPPVHRGDYVVKVPALAGGSNADNNELGTLLLPSVAAAVGTYTSWNLRSRSIGAESELLSLSGGYIPFCRTADQRQARGDPRPALLERYADFDAYRRLFLEHASRMVEQRYLLAEDVPRLEAGLERLRPLFEADGGKQ